MQSQRDTAGRPLWRGDGKALFYISNDGKLMAVEVKTGGTFEPCIPRALFDLQGLRKVTSCYDMLAVKQDIPGK